MSFLTNCGLVSCENLEEKRQEMESSESEDDCVVYWHSEPVYKQQSPIIPLKTSQTPLKKRDTTAAALPSPSALDPVLRTKPQRRQKRSRKASTSNIKIDDAALKVMDELARRLNRHNQPSTRTSAFFSNFQSTSSNSLLTRFYATAILPSTIVKLPKPITKPFLQKITNKLPTPKPNPSHLPSPESLPRLQPTFPRPALKATLSDKAKEKQKEIEQDEFDEYFGKEEEGFELAVCSQAELVEIHYASQSRNKGKISRSTVVSPNRITAPASAKSVVVVPPKVAAPSKITAAVSTIVPPPKHLPPPKPKSTVVVPPRTNPFAKNTVASKSKPVVRVVPAAQLLPKAKAKGPTEKRAVQKSTSQAEIDALIDGVDLDNWSDDDF